MAATDAMLAAVTQPLFNAGLPKTKNLALNVLRFLNKMAVSQTEVKWPVNVGGGTPSGQLITADSPAATSDTVVEAMLPIGVSRISQSFDIKKVDIREATVAGPPAIRDLLAVHINAAAENITMQLGSRVFDGDGTAVHGGIIGLATAVGTTTYAGIDPATHAAWISGVQSTVGALTIAKMRTGRAPIWNAGKDYNLVIGPHDLVDAYAALFDTDYRINLPAAGLDIPITMGFEQRPIMRDSRATAGAIYFLNSNWVRMHYFPIGPELVDANTGIRFYLFTRPTDNPDMLQFNLSVRCQLQLEDRTTASKMTGVTAA